MKRILLFGIFAAALLSVSSCSNDYTKAIPKGFDEYCQKTMEEWHLPGMAVAVVKDGETVFVKGYGMTSLEGDGKPVDGNTQFVIASTSKAFTAALLADVMDDYPEIEWNDRVVEHLPDFKLYDEWATENMMVKEIMTHHTGFDDYALDDLPFFGYDRDDLYHLFASIKPSHSFRSFYGYNNEMFTVTARIIEKYTGKSWDDNIFERIFTPLGMENSTTVNRAFYSAPNLAHGYRVAKADNADSLVVTPREDRDDAFTWLSAVAPAGGVISTVNDMTNWLKFNLNHGVFNGDTLISRKNHDFLFYPQTITSYNSTRLCNYAQGWTIEQNQYGRYIRHTGLAYGYTAIVGMVPDMDLGFVILTNNGTSSDPQAAIGRQLIDMYRGVKDSDWSRTYLAEFMENGDGDRSKPAQEEQLPQLANSAYIGRYYLEAFGEAKVYEKGGALFLKLKDLDSQLEYKNGNAFEFKVPGAGKFQLTFDTGKNNRAVSFIINFDDPTGDFKRL